MTKLYKLTNSEYKTRKGESNETTWGENVTHVATGTGGLCTSGVIHAYRDPLLAVLLNPIHVNFSNPVLWEAVGEIVEGKPDKCGVKALTTLRIISLPEISTESKVRFAIGCVLRVYRNQSFVTWALNWLNGSDRSAYAADASAATPPTLPASAANAAASAAYAAASAASTANAAASAAYAADSAAYAANAAAYAADADAANAAAYADAADAADADLTWQYLLTIAQWAIGTEIEPPK